MQRRDLLKMTALAPCTPLILGGCVTKFAGTKATTRRRVRPTDEAWPNKESWRRLNDEVGGNLIPVQPLFACALPSERASCADVSEHLSNPFYLGDQPAGTQVSGWLDAWTPAPSAYAIRARTTADIVAGVNFARRNHLRLVVKGTGHSYLGTSNAADSLLIWTRAMNRVQVLDAFVPKSCSVAPVSVVMAEPGAVSIDLYYAVTTGAGRYVQGGGCTDTGVAGLVQSGGFGSFSKGYGTAASSLLEAEVVTADGSVLTANACLNPDLFWALKGGGGGTFGVITRVILQTHELPKNFGGASAIIKAQSDSAFKRLIGQFLTFYQESLLNPHWGEQVKVRPDNTLEISMASQGFEQDQIYESGNPSSCRSKHPRRLQPDENLGGFAVPARTYLGTSKQSSQAWFMTRVLAPLNSIAGGAVTRGRSARSSMATTRCGCPPTPRGKGSASARGCAVRCPVASNTSNSHEQGPRRGHARAAKPQCGKLQPILQYSMPLPSPSSPTGKDRLIPGMPRAAVDLGAARADSGAIDRAAAELRKVVPEAGSHVSKSKYFNPSWQHAHWGDNYPRLRHQEALRSRRSALRAPWRRQRGVEPGRILPVCDHGRNHRIHQLSWLPRIQ